MITQLNYFYDIFMIVMLAPGREFFSAEYAQFP